VRADRALRERVEHDLQHERWPLARQHLAALWAHEPSLATAGYLLRVQERLRPHLDLTPCRLAVLRSFTVEPLVPLVRAGAFAGGLDLAVHLGGFNAYAQEMLDPRSGLYEFQPGIAILAVQPGDLPPGREAPALGEYVAAFRARSDAALVIHDFGVPELDAELRRLAGEQAGVYALPYRERVAGHGIDERNRTAMGMPLANEALLPLSREWLRFIHPLGGRVSKALVTDLDNTLWAGVIGEDGITGIASGPEGPHRELQAALLELHARGILLAVCSKNDEADALEALERHPGLLVRPAHFAALRINWRDKPENLRQIAAELGIGTDALAFLDDDPVERERVRSELPEVAVLEPAGGAQSLAAAVRDSPLLARLALSAEDRARQRHYAERRTRDEARRAAPSLEEFYRSLAQEVTVERMTPETAERAAQLTQKTNQFNLTTRRYALPELQRLFGSGEAHVFTARVVDCYGDNGLTALAILRDTPSAVEIDTLLLSCRVIGRGVETALLSFLAERARARQQPLRGRFVPTKKNALARDFFRDHGFRLLEEGAEGTVWALEAAARIECPSWIRLTVAEGARA
jgi:FkbH-like protein